MLLALSKSSSFYDFFALSHDKEHELLVASITEGELFSWKKHIFFTLQPWHLVFVRWIYHHVTMSPNDMIGVVGKWFVTLNLIE